MLRALILAAAAATFAAAGFAAGPPVAGHYRLTGVMETASELELTPDGRFRWAYSAGALDLTAAGRWHIDHDRVLLDSDQPVVPPRFSAVSAASNEEPDLQINVVGPSGDGIALIQIEAVFDHGEPAATYTQSYGARVRLRPGSTITRLRLGLPAFGIDWQAFPVDMTKGNVLRFLLTPNDFGKRDFRAEPLAVAPGALLMTMGGRPVRYERMERE